MKNIRTFLLDVEGDIFQKMFSTAPVLFNNSTSRDNTRLDDELERVFEEHNQNNAYTGNEFGSYPYEMFTYTVNGLGVQALHGLDRHETCTLEELTRSYENGLLSACEYWAIIGLLYLIVVREGSSNLIPAIQKAHKASEAVHNAFYALATEEQWNYKIDYRELFIEERFCQKLEELMTTLLKKSLSRIETLDGLVASTYQHPADRMILKRLAAIPLVGTACAQISNLEKRYIETMLLACCQRVTPNSHPRLYKLFWTAAKILDMPKVPELYIDSIISKGLNAFTTGSDDKAFIALSSQIVYQFDERELLYVIGHEMGHIQCGHQKYTMLAEQVLNGACYVPVLGSIIQGLGNATIGPLFNLWSRYSELSCDRAGLLCCQSREAALRANVKMAGQPWSQYNSIRTRTLIDQTILFDQLTQKVGIDQFYTFQHLLVADHPFTVYRASELLKWIANGEYDELVNNDRNGRAALVERLKLDDETRNLYRYAERALVEWHLEKYPSARRKPIAREVRKVLYESRQADASPVSNIFEVSMQVRQIDASTYEYHLVFKTIYDGKPAQFDAKLNVQENDRDSVPESIRNQFLKTNSNVVEMCLFKA